MYNSIIVLTIFTSLSTAAALQTKEYTYLRTTGEEKTETRIQLEQTDTGFVLTKQNAQEDVKIVCDKSGDTQRLEYKNTQHQIQIRAVRKNQALIKVTGMVADDPVDEEIEIEDHPWYQEVGFSIQSFLRSEANSTQFWMLHPKKVSAYKMKITKVGKEMVELAGKKLQATKTEMIIDAFFLSVWWSAYHWHRTSDGLFIRYHGEGASPGADDTHVTIIKGM